MHTGHWLVPSTDIPYLAYLNASCVFKEAVDRPYAHYAGLKLSIIGY